MTEEELIATEQKEHERALETIAVITALLNSFSNSVTNDFHAWYRKYSDNYSNKYSNNGIVRYSDSRKFMTVKEVQAFNKRYGTNFKRLRRDKALFFIYAFNTDKFLSDYISELRKLGVTVVGYEAGLLKYDFDSESVLETPWGSDKTNYKERIGNKKNQILYDLSTATKRGLARGDSAEVIAMALVEVANSLKRNISAMVLTEATAFASIAKMKVYKHLFPNKHFRNVEVMDEKTCPICIDMNGKVFEMRSYEVGVTAPPYHPRCRGTTIIVD